MIVPIEYKIHKPRGRSHCIYAQPAPVYEMQLRITDKCNYNCKYCHWKYGEHYNLDDIIKTISIATDCIDRDSFRIYFHGGEPTIHPYYLDIIEFIFTLDYNIVVELQTNLSKGVRGLQKLIKKFKQHQLEINVSYHPNQVKNFDLFKQKLDIVYKSGMLNKIDVMMEHDEKAKEMIIDQSKKLLEEPYNDRIEFIYGYINYKNTIDMYKDFVEDNTIFNEQYEVTHESGERAIYNTNDLYSQGINFTGWYCSSGKDYIIINGNGDYFMCCANMFDTKPTGNLIENEALFKVRTSNYTKCKWSSCKGEFYLKKYKK